MIKKILKPTVLLLAFSFCLSYYNGTTLFTPKARAASMSYVSDSLSRIQESTLANHTFQFVLPTGITASTQRITIVLPSGFSTAAFDYTNIDLAVGSAAGVCSGWTDRTLSSAAAADVWYAWGNAAGVITLQAPTSITTSGIAAGYCAQVEIGSNATSGGTGTTQITNQTVAQNTANPDITIASWDGATGMDLGTATVRIIADDTVNIYATVDPILGFTISDTAVGFGTFTAGAIRYATDDAVGTGSVPSTPPVTLAAASNANSGYYIRIRSTGTGSSAGMYNAVANALIAASGVNSITTSTEAYGAYANLLTGTGLTIGTFSGATSTTALTTSDQTLASTTGPTLTGTAALFLKANVLGTSKAGAYSDTLTLTCTATF